MRLLKGDLSLDMLTSGGLVPGTSSGLKFILARVMRVFISAPICQILEHVPFRGVLKGILESFSGHVPYGLFSASSWLGVSNRRLLRLNGNDLQVVCRSVHLCQDICHHKHYLEARESQRRQLLRNLQSGILSVAATIQFSDPSYLADGYPWMLRVAGS